jgi:hypothetical protein
MMILTSRSIQGLGLCVGLEGVSGEVINQPDGSGSDAGSVSAYRKNLQAVYDEITTNRRIVEPASPGGQAG